MSQEHDLKCVITITGSSKTGDTDVKFEFEPPITSQSLWDRSMASVIAGTALKAISDLKTKHDAEDDCDDSTCDEDYEE